MKSHMSYREIPKAERKLLASEAYRNSRALRTIRFATVFMPIFVGGALAKEFAPADNFAMSLLAAVGFASVICAAIWEILGRPKLRSEIERLKNA